MEAMEQSISSKNDDDGSKTTLFVNNIPCSWTKFHLYRLFKWYGVVNDVRIPEQISKSHCKYGFVDMLREKQADRARVALHRLKLIGDAKPYKEGVGCATIDLFPCDLSRPLMIDRCRIKPPHRQTPPAAAASMLSSEEGVLQPLTTNTANPKRTRGRLNRSNKRQTQQVNGWRTEPLPYRRSVNVKVPSGRRSVKDPSRFHLVLADNEKSFKAFETKFTEACSGSGVASDDFAPKIGDLVAAQNSDGNWYRVAVVAKLTEEDNQGRYDCFTVDYGGIETFSLAQMKAIPNEHHITYRAQAIRCSLYGVMRKGETWDMEAIAGFLLAIADDEVRTMTATLICYDGPNNCRVLLHTVDGSGVSCDVSARLLELGVCTADPDSPYADEADEVSAMASLSIAERVAKRTIKYGRARMETIRDAVKLRTQQKQIVSPVHHVGGCNEWCRGFVKPKLADKENR